MATLDFPNSPTTGQTYTGPGGVVWSFDGAKWVNGASATAFAPINAPVFTGDARAVTASVGDNDTSIATTAFVQAAVTATPAFNGIGRNLLHNLLFNVAQRGAGPFTAFGAYTLDRWRLDGSTDTVSAVRGALADADRAVIGDEAATYYLSTTFTGNVAAAATTFLEQRIEGVRRFSGKTVTVSFWANASSALKFGINAVQIFGTGGSPSGAVLALATGNAVTLSAAFARYSTTIAIPSTSGKVLGTNGDDCTYLRLYCSSGASGNAQAGNIGVQSGTINIWGVQLEIGNVATPLEKPDPRYDLANCQRFYTVGSAFVASYATAGTTIGSSVYFPVNMRIAPVMILTPTGNSNVGTATITAAGAQSALYYATITVTGGGQIQGNFAASADL